MVQLHTFLKEIKLLSSFVYLIKMFMLAGIQLGDTQEAPGTYITQDYRNNDTP